MTARNAYVKKLKEQLDQWNAELSKLEAKATKPMAGMKDAYEKQLKELRGRRNVVQQQVAAGCGQSLHRALQRPGLAEPAQCPGGDRHVRETAGHRQAAVVRMFVQHQHGRARAVPIPRHQPPAIVAGDHQMTHRRSGFQVQFHHPHALRTVARAGEGDQQSGSRWRNSSQPFEKQPSATGRENGYPKFGL